MLHFQNILKQKRLKVLIDLFSVLQGLLQTTVRGDYGTIRDKPSISHAEMIQEVENTENGSSAEIVVRCTNNLDIALEYHEELYSIVSGTVSTYCPWFVMHWLCYGATCLNGNYVFLTTCSHHRGDHWVFLFLSVTMYIHGLHSRYLWRYSNHELLFGYIWREDAGIWVECIFTFFRKSSNTSSVWMSQSQWMQKILVGTITLPPSLKPNWPQLLDTGRKYTHVRSLSRTFKWLWRKNKA